MAYRVLVRGSGDVGSAVAHALFLAGHRPAIHDAPDPAVARRLMAYSDALYDDRAELDGVVACHCPVEGLPKAMTGAAFIPITAAAFTETLAAQAWDVLVDARMRKRCVPEDQRGLAPLVIGLGPNFQAGGNADIAIETSYEDLGRVLREGTTP